MLRPLYSAREGRDGKPMFELPKGAKPGQPKKKADMSADELASLERAELRAQDHQVDVALRQRQRREALRLLKEAPDSKI